MQGMQPLPGPPAHDPAPKAARHGLLWLLIALAWVVPAGPVLTLLLFPWWSWLERATGWESMGHSGPAGWCFVAVWCVLLALALLVPLLARRLLRSPCQPPP